MTKGRNTRVIGVRVRDEVWVEVVRRASGRGFSVSEFVAKVIEREVMRRR